MSNLWNASDGVEKVATGAKWLEGPAWTPWGLVLSDIHNNRIVRISPENAAKTGQPQEFEVLASQVDFSNGRTVSRDGRVFQCSHGHRAIEELHQDGTAQVLVDHYLTPAGRSVRLNSPNDITVGPDDALYFTDPPYGIIQANEGHLGEQEYGDHYVFRLDLTTQELSIVVTDVEDPNGLAFSPDGRTLYVADTSTASRADGLGNQWIRAYDFTPGKAGKNGRTLASMVRGLADGFRVDVEGHIWTSHGKNITILSPNGTWLENIEIPETVGNLTFGGANGSDLFLAASTSVYRLHTFTHDAKELWK